MHTGKERAMPVNQDKICIKDLALRARLPGSAWKGTEISLQPVVLNITLHTNVALAGGTDDLSKSVSYSELAKESIKLVEGSADWTGGALQLVDSVADFLWNATKAILPPGLSVTVRADQTRALLHAQSAGVQVHKSDVHHSSKVFIKDLRLSTIYGVNDCERERPQPAILSLEAELKSGAAWDFASTASTITAVSIKYQTSDNLAHEPDKHVESNHPLTVETLLELLAQRLLASGTYKTVTLTLDKPAANAWSLPSVSVTRHQLEPVALLSKRTSKHDHIAYIGLGGNIGDTERFIRQALDELDASNFVDILDTSFLYQSQPMYHEDQALFLNGVAKVSSLVLERTRFVKRLHRFQIATSLSPRDLLAFTQATEQSLGREKSFRNGPRLIDLDILLYDAEQVSDKEVDLIIPHPRIAEREFVLRPLAE